VIFAFFSYTTLHYLPRPVFLVVLQPPLPLLARLPLPEPSRLGTPFLAIIVLSLSIYFFFGGFPVFRDCPVEDWHILAALPLPAPFFLRFV